MSNLTRIQPQVSLIIHYTGVQQTIDYKTPSHFMLSAMAPHGREMSQDLRKKIIYLHKKGEGYKKISKALLISQNTVAKVVQTFKKDGTATISQRRPGRPRKLTPRQERLLMRRVEENQVEHHSPSSIQSLKEVILEEWKKIDLAKCRQLVHSMPRRLGAVIKNHGAHTKY